MVFVDASKYDVFPEGLESVIFYDTLDEGDASIPKTSTWWQQIMHRFRPPIRIKRIDSICSHPDIYWNGYYLESNPPQIVIRYNPARITRIQVEDFMYSLGGYVVKDERRKSLIRDGLDMKSMGC
jgi:hypothetical protein